MKISADWLSDFVDLSGLDPDALAETLTVRTAEVEGVELVKRRIAGVVVGEITRAELFDGGGKPRYACTVDIGGRTYETVCGAPNVRVGMKSAFATAGTLLQSGEEVAETTLYGRVSEGILCAPGEIGLGTTKDGILDIPVTVPTGTPLVELLPETDTIIEIDNKSLTHRPDLWGHYGFAREFAAVFGRTLRAYEVDDLPTEGAAVRIAVDDALDCPLYSALGFTVSHNPASPLRIQSRLLSLGHAPINMLVDVTNYVQFELGQPTHAFDARCLNDVRVARAGSARPFTTLDGKTWKLQADDLLIWNGDEPVALAGIMGGLDSRILADTRSLVLESATFKASRVRQTSVRLGLRTDSSLRFEKKPPPVYARIAAGRILYQLREAGLEPQATTKYTAVGEFHDAPRTVSLGPGWLARRAGTPLDHPTVTRILTSIGLGCDVTPEGGYTVTIPPFRSVADLSIPEDISEEVFRLYGYDNFTPKPPDGPLAPVPPHTATRCHHRARRVLSQGHRFTEVQTYSWFANDFIKGIDYEPAHPLTLKNPIGANNSRMRDTIVPNLLAAAQANRNVAERYRLYELGRTFTIGEDGQKREANQLAGIVVDQTGASPEVSLRTVRAAIDDVCLASGLGTPTFVPCESGPPWQRKGRALRVSIGATELGHVGVLPDALAAKRLNAGHLVWFSIATAPLEVEVYPAVKHVAPPQFPGSWQDFTFTWPVVDGYAALMSLLDTFAHPLIQDREFVSVYQPKASSTANYSVRYLLGIADRTVTQADLDDFRAKFLVFVATSFLTLA